MFTKWLLFILPILQSTIALKCWLWHIGGIPYEELDIRNRVVMPQCYFQMDIPCLTNMITFSVRTSVTYSAKEHNICYIDKHYNAQIRCACDTDNCSTNCTQIVTMWKKSPQYEAEGLYARCMKPYEEACFANKIKTPVKGQTWYTEERH